jgi:hypothetical protein
MLMARSTTSSTARIKEVGSKRSKLVGRKDFGAQSSDRRKHADKAFPGSRASIVACYPGAATIRLAFASLSAASLDQRGPPALIWHPSPGIERVSLALRIADDPFGLDCWAQNVIAYRYAPTAYNRRARRRVRSERHRQTPAQPPSASETPRCRETAGDASNASASDPRPSTAPSAGEQLTAMDGRLLLGRTGGNNDKPQHHARRSL